MTVKKAAHMGIAAIVLLYGGIALATNAAGGRFSESLIYFLMFTPILLLLAVFYVELIELLAMLWTGFCRLIVREGLKGAGIVKTEIAE